MFVLVAGSGCKKSAPAPAPAPGSAPAPAAETVARLHWLGLQRLARETNTTHVLSIWDLPESKQCLAQTLDKLALALGGGTPAADTGAEPSPAKPPSLATNRESRVTNYHALVASHPVAARLCPLLDDLVQAESYVEFRQPTNQPGELALAVRLSDEQASVWATNLAAALEGLGGSRAAAGPAGGYGWAMQVTNRPANAGGQAAGMPRQVELTRAGDWTLVGLGGASNGLVQEVRGRILQQGGPGGVRATNYWLEAKVDLSWLGRGLGLAAARSAALPRLAVTVFGSGGEVRTAGELKFPQPLPFEAAAWNIPTNLVYEDLTSFTAIRGFRPWLTSQKVWQDLGLGATPDQVFFWARAGLPFLDYWAVPLPNASNCVARLTERLLTEGNAWITTNARTSFARSPRTNGVVMSAPYLEPYLEWAQAGGSDYVVGGLLRQGPGTNSLAPPTLFHEVTRRTNLVAFDWELTGPRTVAWLYTADILRLLFFRDRLPPACATFKWFTAAVPRLGNCVTAVLRTAPDELSFVRQSSIGLTSVELHLLADWLESPRFPYDLSSRAAHRPVEPTDVGPGTNSVPAPPPRR